MDKKRDCLQKQGLAYLGIDRVCDILEQVANASTQDQLTKNASRHICRQSGCYGTMLALPITTLI